jgi:hypothetical protein
MERLRKSSILMFLAVGCVILLIYPVIAIEFSADSIHKTSGRTFKSKIYYKQDKIRMEVLDTVHKGYNIIRKDKEIMWMIMPEQRMWMEVPFNVKSGIQFEKKVKGEVSRKLIGTETINGHPTKKYEVTLKYRDSLFKVYQWIATDIDFTIKSAAIDGSWSQELKNIKIEKQPNNLFEIPTGYQKINIPEMGKGMMHGNIH